MLNIRNIVFGHPPLTTQEKMKNTSADVNHFTHVYQKLWSYDVWFLRYTAQWTEFFVILSHFLGLTKSKFWKNEKKVWKYYHRNGSWDTEHDRHNFLLSFIIFYPPKKPGNLNYEEKIFKKSYLFTHVYYE